MGVTKMPLGNRRRLSTITFFALKVGDEWRLAVDSRTGRYESCLDLSDAKEKGEAILWREGGGALEIFDN